MHEDQSGRTAVGQEMDAIEASVYCADAGVSNLILSDSSRSSLTAKGALTATLLLMKQSWAFAGFIPRREQRTRQRLYRNCQTQKRIHRISRLGEDRVSMFFDQGLSEEELKKLAYDNEVKNWKLRETVARAGFGALVELREDQKDERLKRAVRREAGEDLDAAAGKSALGTAAAAVVIGAILIRFGGRALLTGFLGLDMIRDMGVQDQVDQVLQFSNGLADPVKFALFALAWVVIKIFLIDGAGVILGITSGVLFGGVFQGALASSAGSTIGALACFFLARTLLRDRVQGEIEKQPVGRGLARVVEEDGFRTVFVFRLAPLIPIPLGAYPYVYGTSKLNPLPMAAGYFLGCFKPYLLDSYVGVLAAASLSGGAAVTDDSRDLILLIGFGALVCVGVFASEIAQEIFDNIQQEIDADELAKAGNGTLTAEAEQEEDKGLVIGPVNLTFARDAVVGAIPEDFRKNAAGNWAQLSDYHDKQFALALKADMKKMQDGAKGGPSSSDWKKEWGFSEDGGYSPEAIRMTEWVLDYEPWRNAFTSGFIGFNFLGSLARKWNEYPKNDAAYSEIINDISDLSEQYSSAGSPKADKLTTNTQADTSQRADRAVPIADTASQLAKEETRLSELEAKIAEVEAKMAKYSDDEK